MIKKPLQSLVVLSLLAGLSLNAAALSMVDANLAKIVKYGETAFAGTVTTVEVVETSMGWGEQITIEVSDPIYGVEAGATVTWIQARNGEQMRFPGMPEYKPGEEHCVFLTAKAPGSVFQAPMALGQGSFRCHRDSETGELLVRNQFQNRALLKDIDTQSLKQLTVVREKNERQSKVAKGEPVDDKPIVAPELSTERSGAIAFDDLARVARTMKSVEDPEELFSKKGSTEETTATIQQ